MKLVVQRVNSASVEIANEITGKIDHGFLVYLGIHHDDTMEDVIKYATKLKNLRVFEDAITFKIALMVVKYMKYMESLDY